MTNVNRFRSITSAFLLTRPSRGVTPSLEGNTTEGTTFLLTRPSRGVTWYERIHLKYPIFLLTRPSRGVTKMADAEEDYTEISTHTPLAGRDCLIPQGGTVEYHFYSHAPRGA